ncbi:LOB domain-containing protein 25-like protein [Cinnamomum micranthum f. kanehirae]|uniref:LOB domain-containing protein 25-like protein n=1 Tax=Cinnamomum micranthum f. kanehirae TaxID=337451 RepID=A0A443Q3E6_9MAGN|nr:LOB domain-containing protein 25-like protein [Cinnamomum micranthum f. kanehirae]
MDLQMQMRMRTNQPCAACRMLRRRCSDSCLLAPYFPAEETDNFIHVHKVFGASNVIKTLQMLDESSREDAVKSMVYEAKARLRDPVYGCTRVICFLQKHVKDLEAQLEMTKEQFVESKAQRDQLLEIFMDANRFKSTAPINNEVFDRYDWNWDDNTFGCDPFEYSTDLFYENLGFQDQHGQTSCLT